MLFDRVYPVTCHTDHVGQGSTFVAIRGHSHDGVKFVDEALDKGASTIIIKNNTTITQRCGVNYIFVEDCRIALSELSAAKLGNPASKLKIIGITGTCGKTTTTFLIEHILRKSSRKTALLGSVKNKILDEEEDVFLTTQTSDYIQMFLAECVRRGVEYVIMEVSSHGLALSRTHGLTFEAVGFTNLSSEHMDFHLTLDNYFETKLKIFDQIKPGGVAIINTDDNWGFNAQQILKKDRKDIIPKGFGQSSSSDIKIAITQNDLQMLSLIISEFDLEFHTQSLLGDFNAYNIAMAILICEHLGLSQNEIEKGISEFKGAPGRQQHHKLKNGASAFVDYAHKPDAMEKVLKNLRAQTNDLIIVFGCGGNRDKTKRPVMGFCAANYGDKIIITDDNPRDEDRQIIANEIISGIPEIKLKSVQCILDRALAIRTAAQNSKPSSIIAILGKGHENYYLIKGKKYHFDDFEEISKF